MVLPPELLVTALPRCSFVIVGIGGGGRFLSRKKVEGWRRGGM